MTLTKLLKTTTLRVVLIYLGLFCVSVFTVLASLYWNTAGFLARQMDETILAEIQGLGEQYGQRGHRGLIQVIQDRSRVADESIYLFASPSRDPMAGNLQAWPDLVHVGNEWYEFQYEVTTPDGVETRDARGRLFVLARNYHLLVARDVHDRREIEDRIKSALFWAVILTVILGVSGALVISRNLVGRIDDINRTSQDIMAGDLSQRVPVIGTGDEMDRLAGNLNAMLDKIERLMAGMREVTDNIAHDLRSPLNRLRNRLEVTLMEEPDAGAYGTAIEKTIEETDALLGTFNALLSIARAEAGSGREAMRQIDLKGLVNDTAELYEPVAEDKNQSFQIELEDVPEVHGNRELIAQAIANLLDNAIKYSPPGGEIGISLKPGQKGSLGEPEMIRLTVRDTGPGIPAVDRDRVKDRFVRLERSRNAPGSGLGLSLVAAVARLHDARFILSDNDPDNKPHGLRALIVFPVAQKKELQVEKRDETGSESV